MRRTLTLFLTLLLLAAACSGCSPKREEQPPLTAEERTELYRTAIENARDPDTNAYLEIVTSSEDPLAEILFLMLELEEEDLSAYALSVSPVNIRAYGIVAALPAAGKEDDVHEALSGFVDRQKESFFQYLEEEYDIASNARLETLEDGTLLLVMCEDQDAVFDSIRDSIERAQ